MAHDICLVTPCGVFMLAQSRVVLLDTIQSYWILCSPTGYYVVLLDTM